MSPAKFMGRLLRRKMSLTQKRKTGLAEISIRWHWRLSGVDSALLAWQLHRQQNGNSLSLWNARHQCHGFVSYWPDLCVADSEDTLESQLAILDPNWLHRRLHDLFEL